VKSEESLNTQKGTEIHFEVAARGAIAEIAEIALPG
jgi:hypothetical protein